MPRSGPLMTTLPNVLHWKIPRGETYVRGPSYTHAMTLLERLIVNISISDVASLMVLLHTYPPDIEKCIGCGTCEAICQNKAIDMVPVEGIPTKQGDSGLRPNIDYGRCCWCALCVDVCMTKSLTMSNAYTWVESDPDAFRFTPGVDKKHWDNAELGYRRPDGHRLTEQFRVAMGEMEPQTRIESFTEIVAGYDIEQARLEADRCVACGLCVATCPAHMAVPDYIAAVRDDEQVKLLAVGMEILVGVLGSVVMGVDQERH